MISIWSLLKVKGEPGGMLEDPGLHRIIREHKLEGLIYHRWGDFLPGELRGDYQKKWMLQWARNRIHHDEYLKIQTALQTGGISVGALKGCALLSTLYPDFGSRFMSDVDIWVDHPERARPHLENLGYRGVSEIKWEANAHKATYAKTVSDMQVTVEVHEKLSAEEPEGWRWNWRRENDLVQLDGEDMLLHLCTHLGFQHTFLKLFWLVDVDLFVRANLPRLDWAKLQDRATAFGHAKSLAAVLFAAHFYLGTPVARKCRLVSPALALLISDGVLLRGRPGVGYYILKHLLKESWSQALAYDRQWVMSHIKARLARRMSFGRRVPESSESQAIQAD